MSVWNSRPSNPEIPWHWPWLAASHKNGSPCNKKRRPLGFAEEVWLRHLSFFDFPSIQPAGKRTNSLPKDLPKNRHLLFREWMKLGVCLQFLLHKTLLLICNALTRKGTWLTTCGEMKHPPYRSLRCTCAFAMALVISSLAGVDNFTSKFLVKRGSYRYFGRSFIVSTVYVRLYCM